MGSTFEQEPPSPSPFGQGTVTHAEGGDAYSATEGGLSLAPPADPGSSSGGGDRPPDDAFVALFGHIAEGAGHPASSAGQAGLLPGSAGEPIVDRLRGPLEASYDTDLGDVRLHSGAEAAGAADALDARAVTKGKHIYFAAGELERDTSNELLAHEVSHASKARSDGGEGGPVSIADPQSAAENEADEDAAAFMRGKRAAPSRAGHGAAIYRKPKDGTATKGGDVRSTAITAEAASELSAEDLAAQLKVLKAQLETLKPASPEYQAARENQLILQREQITRTVRGGRSANGEPHRTDLPARHEHFRQAVLLAAHHRLTQNQENLAEWRTLIENQLSPANLQTQVLAQSASDLDAASRETGGERAFGDWAGEHNPHLRNVQEHQARGEWRACTGCHESNRAHGLAASEPHVGPAWQSPAERLTGPGERAPGSSDAATVRGAIERIRPIVGPLGDRGYKIIPDEVFSTGAGASPEELRKKLLERIDFRRRSYEELKERIADGGVSYLQLGPVLQALLPTADADVQRAVQDDVKTRQIYALLEIGGTLILTLLSFLFPPLGLAAAAIQFAHGYGSYKDGKSYFLGTGANDVFAKEQQEMAGSLMASGTLNMGMATGVFGASLPPSLDMAATRAITASDMAIARTLAQRAEAGPIPEAELLQLQETGLVARMAQKWAGMRNFQVLYRGQGAPTEEILSPLAREGGIGASERMLQHLRAQGFTDQEIAGYTAKWNGTPVGDFDAPPMQAGQPLGGAGIPTTRLPNIAADFAHGQSGVIYVLRVPKGTPVEVGVHGWGRQSAVEQEWVIFHQIPNGFVVRAMPSQGTPPLRYAFPDDIGPSLARPGKGAP